MNPQTPTTEDSIKRKGGRPRKSEDELRLYPVKVYFDKASYRKLMNRSRRTGQPLSTIVYDLAVNGYVREPFTKEEVTLLRSLSGVANNLNQITRQAHVSNLIEVYDDVKEVVGKIDNLLIRFSEK